MKRLLFVTAALALAVSAFADELIPGEYWATGWGKIDLNGNGNVGTGPYTDGWNEQELGQISLWLNPVSGKLVGDWGELSIGRIGVLENITQEDGGRTINGDWRVISPGVLNSTELPAGSGKFSFVLYEAFTDTLADDSVEVQEAAAISALRRIFSAQTAFYNTNNVYASSLSQLNDADVEAALAGDLDYEFSLESQESSQSWQCEANPSSTSETYLSEEEMERQSEERSQVGRDVIVDREGRAFFVNTDGVIRADGESQMPETDPLQ